MSHTRKLFHRESMGPRLAFAAVALLLISSNLSAQTQTPTLAAPRERIERRTYEFKEANRDQDYAIFIPSSYDKTKKTPLIVALHGLNGNPRQILGTRGFMDLAEKHGYVVVAPYGYNERGWYRARVGRAGAGRGGAAPAGNATNGIVPNGAVQKEDTQPAGSTTAVQAAEAQAPAQGQAGTAQTPVGRGGRRAGRGRGGATNDPPNLGELSEKDVLNVLELVKKEYNIDADRTYLMGHSMGGGGTLYLGPKYAEHWAALAPFAPAIYSSPDVLANVKQLPVIVIQGDSDRLVPVAGTRRWVEKMKELGMTHEYIEVAGGDHMSVVAPNMEKMFDFFNKHTRTAAK